MSQITNAWQALRSNLVRLLKQKQESLMDEVLFDEATIKAVQAYETLRDNTRTFSRSLIQGNEGSED